MTVKSTTPPTLKRQFPHVDDIVDWRAQQTIRLLWDRVFDLEARVQALTTTVLNLVGATNQQETEIADVKREADQALALSQQTKSEETPSTGGGTDSGQGAYGCSVAGSNGDIAGDQTPITAGKIVCGVGNEYPALLAVTATQAARDANRDELLDRIVWHLNQAGYPCSRYPTVNGRPWTLLFDAKGPNGEPVRQYAYRVIDYAAGVVGATSPPDHTNSYTTVMVFGGMTVGATTIPDAGIPD